MTKSQGPRAKSNYTVGPDSVFLETSDILEFGHTNVISKKNEFLNACLAETSTANTLLYHTAHDGGGLQRIRPTPKYNY